MWHGPPRLILGSHGLIILMEVANHVLLFSVLCFLLLDGLLKETTRKHLCLSVYSDPGFFPQGVPPLRQPSSETFAPPPEIWSENNRKISIIIDFAPLKKISGRKPGTSEKEQKGRGFITCNNVVRHSVTARTMWRSAALNRKWM